MTLDAVPGYSAYRCGQLGFAYNEAAFRHFLNLERLRAQQTLRSLLLVLVKARVHQGARPRLDGPSAQMVFHALGSSVREVDFVGWHREGTVAGAVVALTAGAAADVPSRLASRVTRVLREEMAHEQVERLRFRVVRLGGKVKH